MKPAPTPGQRRAVQYIALARSALITLLGLLLVFRAVASPDPGWRTGGSMAAFLVILLGTWMGARAMRRLQQLKVAAEPPPDA